MRNYHRFFDENVGFFCKKWKPIFSIWLVSLWKYSQTWKKLLPKCSAQNFLQTLKVSKDLDVVAVWTWWFPMDTPTYEKFFLQVILVELGLLLNLAYSITLVVASFAPNTDHFRQLPLNFDFRTLQYTRCCGSEYSGSTVQLSQKLHIIQLYNLWILLVSEWKGITVKLLRHCPKKAYFLLVSDATVHPIFRYSSLRLENVYQVIVNTSSSIDWDK
jgi:hypothetical protein